MLGGYSLPRGRITFDFNFTFTRNSTEPFRHIGLLVLNSREALIRDFNIHEHLGIRTKSGIKHSQHGKVIVWNDFSHIELPLDLLVSSTLPGWAIALIVIGSLLFAGLAGFAGWRFYLKSKAAADEDTVKKSLLEEEGEVEGDDDEDDSDDSDDDDDDDEDDDEEGGEKVANTESVVVPTGENVHGASINRDTLESVDIKPEN